MEFSLLSPRIRIALRNNRKLRLAQDDHYSANLKKLLRESRQTGKGDNGDYQNLSTLSLASLQPSGSRSKIENNLPRNKSFDCNQDSDADADASERCPEAADDSADDEDLDTSLSSQIEQHDTDRDKDQGIEDKESKSSNLYQTPIFLNPERLPMGKVTEVSEGEAASRESDAKKGKKRKRERSRRKPESDPEEVRTRIARKKKSEKRRKVKSDNSGGEYSIEIGELKSWTNHYSKSKSLTELNPSANDQKTNKKSSRKEATVMPARANPESSKNRQPNKQKSNVSDLKTIESTKSIKSLRSIKTIKDSVPRRDPPPTPKDSSLARKTSQKSAISGDTRSSKSNSSGFKSTPASKPRDQNHRGSSKIQKQPVDPKKPRSSTTDSRKGSPEIGARSAGKRRVTRSESCSTGSLNKPRVHSPKAAGSCVG